jgi:N-acyl-D-amino-acid deacylase
MIEEMKKTLHKRQSPDYAYAVIASYRTNPALNGLNIAEASKQLRGADTLDDQIETVIEIEKNGGASGVFHGMSDADLEAFMRHPNTMMASDSGVRHLNAGMPHPRGYGNNARVLGLYVREKGVVRLEDAIRKMTSLPAHTFRLRERGQLREGNWADIAVFDPAAVTDPSTYKDPHHYANGFRHVFVNGVRVVENDTHTGARPGMVLRRDGAKKWEPMPETSGGTADADF